MKQSVKEAGKRFVLIITIRKSKKISPVLQQMLKCFTPDRMQSVQRRKIYHLWSSCPETVQVSRRTLIARHTTIFSSWRGSS